MDLGSFIIIIQHPKLFRFYNQILINITTQIKPPTKSRRGSWNSQSYKTQSWIFNQNNQSSRICPIKKNNSKIYCSSNSFPNWANLFYKLLRSYSQWSYHSNNIAISRLRLCQIGWWPYELIRLLAFPSPPSLLKS